MTTNVTPAGRKAAGTAGAPAKPGNKAKKPRKPINPAILCIIIFVVLLAGAGACLYLNVGGIAEKALVLLPQYNISLAALDKKSADLAAQQATLQQQSDKNAADAKANEKAAADLKTQQDQLAADRQALEDQQQQGKSEEEKLKALAGIYSSLDASVAAAMLLKAPSMSDAAYILGALPQDKVAEIITIIEATDAKTAYELAKLIGQ